MSRKAVVLAIVIQTVVFLPGAMAGNIEPANPKASGNARRVVQYLYDLPDRTENRLISGHTGGLHGPHGDGPSGRRICVQNEAIRQFPKDCGSLGGGA